jgi:Mrp family chromosome partitioning ATPase
MSQAKSKFRTTVIGEWIRAPEPIRAANVEPPAPERKTNGNGSSNGSASPGLVVWSAPPAPAAIVQHAWSPKVFAIDEVDLPAHPDPRLIMLREPESARARSFRLLQHRLLARSDPRVIAVTSAEPGEGKTTAAVNLALALAEETMVRVLLVEANLRRPALGSLFDFEPSESFVGRMAECRDSTTPYTVAAILGTRLQVAALPRSVAPDARLDRMLLAVALHELREVFDYVVVDAASVLESADADVACACADGVIVTVRAEKSKKSALKRAIEQLAPARVFGTVLIDS